MPAILDGERELVTPLAVEQHTLYGIERALFGIRWADEIGEGGRERPLNRPRFGTAQLQ